MKVVKPLSFLLAPFSRFCCCRVPSFVSGDERLEVVGDGKDRLEVVGDGVDTVCLVSCLRKKVGHAVILQVEEVKEKKSEEKKKPEEPKVDVQTLPQSCPCYYNHPPLPVVVCDEPSFCLIM